jgi:hypothetical protein
LPVKSTTTTTVHHCVHWTYKNHELERMDRKQMLRDKIAEHGFTPAELAIAMLTIPTKSGVNANTNEIKIASDW